MILDEVVRFRQSVRRQPAPAATLDPNQGRKDSIGIPEQQWAQQARSDVPRPHEANVRNQGLEQDLAGGLDAMHH